MHSDNENSDSSSNDSLALSLIKEVLMTIAAEDEETITSIVGVFDQLKNEATQALEKCHDAVVSFMKDMRTGQTSEPELTQMAKRLVKRNKLKIRVKKYLQGVRKALEELVTQAEKRLEEATSQPPVVEQEALRRFFIDELKNPAEQCQSIQ